MSDKISSKPPDAPALPDKRAAKPPQARDVDVVEGRVFCPFCKQYVQLLRISKAAVVTDVSRRTIYNYIEEGKVFSVKVAGKTNRVCGSCLLQPSGIT